MERDTQRGGRARNARRWRLAGGHVLLSGTFVALAAAAAPGSGFVKHLPQDVPDLARWNKASGGAVLKNGASLEYELYYDNGRSYYEVIRYRLTGWDGGEGGEPYSTNERLQWQAQVKELRRYECEPVGPATCRWRELPGDSPEYRRELQVVMWVLGLHRRLLQEREAGLFP